MIPTGLGRSVIQLLRISVEDRALQWSEDWLTVYTRLLTLHPVLIVYHYCRYVRAWTMSVQVKKWGNSAAIRIPAAMMVAAALHVGQEVEVREEGGRIIIEPVTKPIYTLDELLADMKPETFPEIVDFGSPVGNEVL